MIMKSKVDLVSKIMTYEICIMLGILFAIIIAQSFLGLYPVVLIQEIVDLAIASNNQTKQIIRLGAFYLILQICGKILSGVGKWFASTGSADAMYQLQIGLFREIFRVKFNCMESISDSEISNILLQDIEYIGNNFVSTYCTLVSAIVSFIFGLYFVSKINVFLVVAVIPLGMISSYVIKFFRERVSQNLIIQQTRIAQLSSTFSEGIRGMTALRLCEYFEIYYKTVEDDGRKLKNARKTQGKLEGLLTTVTESSFMATIGAILITTSILVNKKMMSIGGLTAFMMYNHMLTDPLVNFTEMIPKVSRLKVSLERLNKIFKLPKENIADKELTDEIRVKTISFDYLNVPVLKNFSLNISSPECVGIYGESGSGKSTFARLLAGIESPLSGEIEFLYKNVPVTGKPRISYMQQDDYIFDLSIRKNIEIAAQNLSEYQLNHIVEISGLTDALKQHGDEPVGIDGSKLSGGERKRVLIARAIANDQADIYIFDEMSASLDNETFISVFLAVRNYLSHKIQIYIEHNRIVENYFDDLIAFPIRSQPEIK